MKYLYLPVANQQREFDAKLLLALVASEAGFKPIIGYKQAVHAAMLQRPPGIYLAHNAREKATDLIRFREFGHGIVALDEEALVRQSDEIFRRKHPKDPGKYLDQIFTWGKNDHDLWKSAGVPIKVSVTGNPRMDVLREEMHPLYYREVDAIKQQHGEYVLINSNFTAVNNFDTKITGLTFARWARDAEGKHMESDFLDYKKRMLEHFLALVPRLAKSIFPKSLVIRPHPNENHAIWDRVVDDIPNAHVVFDGSVIPWIIGAQAVIQNNCTTAVEAALLGRPVISYRPFRSGFDNEFTNAFGLDCLDERSVITAVKRMAKMKPTALSREQKRKLKQHMSEFDNILCCDKIVDALTVSFSQDKYIPRAGFVHRNNVRANLWFQNITQLAQWLLSSNGRRKRKFVKEHFPWMNIYRLDNSLLRSSERQIERFARLHPPTTSREVDEKIQLFASALNRFRGSRSLMLGYNLFAVS